MEITSVPDIRLQAAEDCADAIVNTLLLRGRGAAAASSGERLVEDLAAFLEQSIAELDVELGSLKFARRMRSAWELRGRRAALDEIRVVAGRAADRNKARITRWRPERRRLAGRFLWKARSRRDAGAPTGFAGLAKGRDSTATAVSTAISSQASSMARARARWSIIGLRMAAVSGSMGPRPWARKSSRGMPTALAVAMSPACRRRTMARPMTGART